MIRIQLQELFTLFLTLLVVVEGRWEPSTAEWYQIVPEFNRELKLDVDPPNSSEVVSFKGYRTTQMFQFEEATAENGKLYRITDNEYQEILQTNYRDEVLRAELGHHTLYQKWRILDVGRAQSKLLQSYYSTKCLAVDAKSYKVITKFCDPFDGRQLWIIEPLCS